MKILIILSISLTFLASCKKDRTCTCSYADGTLYSEGKILNSTKKDARLLCTTKAQGVTCVVK